VAAGAAPPRRCLIRCNCTAPTRRCWCWCCVPWPGPPLHAPKRVLPDLSPATPRPSPPTHAAAWKLLGDVLALHHAVTPAPHHPSLPPLAAATADDPGAALDGELEGWRRRAAALRQARRAYAKALHLGPAAAGAWQDAAFALYHEAQVCVCGGGGGGGAVQGACTRSTPWGGQGGRVLGVLVGRRLTVGRRAALLATAFLTPIPPPPGSSCAPIPRCRALPALAPPPSRCWRVRSVRRVQASASTPPRRCCGRRWARWRGRWAPALPSLGAGCHPSCLHTPALHAPRPADSPCLPASPAPSSCMHTHRRLL
jgi:hypothetical protein